MNHVCFVTKMHKKAAIRKFGSIKRKDPWKQQGEKRGQELFYTPVISEYVEILNRDKMWRHHDETTDKLLGMSQATVKRRVGTFMKARRRKKGLTVTRPSHLKRIVPIFTGPWHDKPPGWGQIDTVLHSNSSSGDAVYTLNYTDAATLLVVPRAQWNGHVIRKTVGYVTLNCFETVDALNRLYDLLTLYLMHFVAVRRMVEKEKLGSRYRRVYEKLAKTPYQRILEHPEVDTEIKEKLRQEHAKLNPLILTEGN